MWMLNALWCDAAIARVLNARQKEKKNNIVVDVLPCETCGVLLLLLLLLLACSTVVSDRKFATNVDVDDDDDAWQKKGKRSKGEERKIYTPQQQQKQQQKRRRRRRVYDWISFPFLSCAVPVRPNAPGPTVAPAQVKKEEKKKEKRVRQRVKGKDFSVSCRLEEWTDVSYFALSFPHSLVHCLWGSFFSTLPTCAAVCQCVMTMDSAAAAVPLG